MIKILSVIVFLSSNIFAQIDFDEFLNDALKNSPYLKSNALSIKQSTLKGRSLNIYKNPLLELEYSQFKPERGVDEDGYRVAISQPLRLWGVGSDKEKLAKSMELKLSASYTLSHAKLVKKISLLFAEYSKKQELYLLAKEELEISEKIYEISKERYKAGTIAKGMMLQAKVDFEMVDIYLDSLYLSLRENYFSLLEVAGYSNEIELNHRHIFKIKESMQSFKNPDLGYVDSLKNESIATSKLNSNKIEYVDLLAEFENEPDENIFRVGVSIPLAIFDTKKEQLQIAKLQTQKIKLQTKKQNDAINLKVLKLTQQRDMLKRLKIKNMKTLQSQKKLLEMFEEGYKIASINLLELQNTKNRVIKTKESLIKIKFALYFNAIITNYISGAYNE